MIYILKIPLDFSVVSEDFSFYFATEGAHQCSAGQKYFQTLVKNRKKTHKVQDN